MRHCPRLQFLIDDVKLFEMTILDNNCALRKNSKAVTDISVCKSNSLRRRVVPQNFCLSKFGSKMSYIQ